MLYFSFCTTSLEVNVSALIYRLFHADFSLIIGTNSVFTPMIKEKIFMKQSVRSADKLTFEIFVHKALH